MISFSIRWSPWGCSAKLWIRRGSGCDQQGQRGGHQLLGSVLSRGCGPLDHLQLADLVEGCGAGLRCDTHEDGILISLKCRDLDADRLLPAVGWMVRQPHLNEGQIALERELSLQALQRQRETPSIAPSMDGGRWPMAKDRTVTIRWASRKTWSSFHDRSCSAWLRPGK